MSEPVSKAEIEDVLSSIRRLVSENAGALRREQDQGESRDKLVLTPAFRVDEDSAEQDGAEADDDRVETATGEPETTPDAVVADLVEADRAANASTGESAEAPPEATDYSPPEADHAPRADAPPLSPLEQRIAELEAVVARSAAEFEPDGSEADEMPDTFVFHHQAKEPQADVGTLPEQAAAPAPVPDQPQDTAPAAPAPIRETWGSDPSQAEAAPATETAASQAEDTQDATPGPGDVPAPDTARDWQDVPIKGDEAEVPEAGFVNVEEDAWEDVDAAGFSEAVDDDDFEEEIDNDDIGIDDAEEASGGDDDGAVLDEAALREMVARMVRDELQGTVGERITHNVRRMVRREIARALSLQEFE
jgi:hypothetical protein